MRPGDRIDAQALVQSCVYTTPGHAQTAEALKVVGLLDEWMEENSQSIQMSASVTIGSGFLQIFIGTVCVWSSEEDDEKDMSPHACVAAYRRHIDDLLEPFQTDNTAQKRSPESGIAYWYLDDADRPLEHCPNCKLHFTSNSTIEVHLVIAGLRGTAHTRLTTSGFLIDTDDGAIAKGLHSETRCAECGIVLTDYERRVPPPVK